MYKVPIIIRVSQSSKKTAMRQMQKGLEIRISQRGRFPPRETLKWDHWMQMQIIIQGSWYHRKIS
jgi:hypothetical protein